MNQALWELIKSAGFGFAGDQLMKRSGLGERAESILDKIIPPAAASGADAIDTSRQDQLDALIAQENMMRDSSPAQPVLPATSRAPVVQQAYPQQLPDIQMGNTPEEVADQTRDFVREFSNPIMKNAQRMLASEVPREVAQDPEMQKAAVATSGTQALAASGDAINEPGFFDKAGDFFSELFGDEERMTRLALAFNSMRFEPDQGLASVLGKRLESIESRRQSSLTANRTIDALKKIGTPAALKYAAMIQANPSMTKEIYTEYVKSAGTGFDKDIVKGESDLRKEFTGLPTVKDFQSQSTAFGRVVASAKDPSAAGDLALIFNYMKVLDPGSTVREGEFATAQNASGVPGRVQSLYNNIIRGERLNEDQRADFVDRARRLYMSAASSYEGIRDDYVDIASSYKFDVERTVPDLFSQQKNIVDPPKPSYGSLPDSVKSKYSADDFDRLWNGMSYLTKLQLSGS
jgi:hypothetical protein